MTDLLERDRKYIWHPYTQHKTEKDPLEVVWAEGSFLYTADGRSIYDAISSWWVILHGHCHPYMIAKVQEQLGRLEHVHFAGCTHQPAVTLAERILALLPGFSKVFYSDNGSTSVEIGLKMALQFWSNQGVKKKKILALRGGYHGDTFGAMSVSDRSVFTNPFSDHMFAVDYVDPPLRKSTRGHAFNQLEALLNASDEYAAFIFEPMVQGTGGMLMHDATELSQMIQLAQERKVLCIADEVMTGFGRTGKLFASEYLSQSPDIICIAKGLTGGTMPLAMTICREHVYEGFLSEDRTKTFFHGHSFTANPVACAAALASLDLLMKKESKEGRTRIATHHSDFCAAIDNDAQAKGWFNDVRQLGTILALEWKSSGQQHYLHGLRDTMYSFFLERGVLLRPLGTVLYILPPYSSAAQELEQTYSAIMDFGRSHFS